MMAPTRILSTVALVALVSASSCWDACFPNTNKAMIATNVVFAEAGPPQLIHGDASNQQAYVIAVMGDGFTADAASIQAFRTAADEFKNELLATPPFSYFPEALTIWRVDALSQDEGITVPASCNGAGYSSARRNPATRATVFGTHWCGQSDATGAMNPQFLDATDEGFENIFSYGAHIGTAPTATVVIANDSMYGATAFHSPAKNIVLVSVARILTAEQYIPAGGGPAQPMIDMSHDGFGRATFPAYAIHEVGHLHPFKLLDEYGSGGSATLPSSASTIVNQSPNLSTDTATPPAKWAALADPSVQAPVVPCVGSSFALPVPPALPPVVIGSFANGFSYDCGVVHSQPGCKMNADFHHPFCLVCRRRLEGQVSSFVPVTPRGFRLRILAEYVNVKPAASGSAFRLQVVFSGAGVVNPSERWPAHNLVRGPSNQPGEIKGFTSNPALPSQVNVALLRGAAPGRLVETVGKTISMPATSATHAFNGQTFRAVLSFVRER